MDWVGVWICCVFVLVLPEGTCKQEESRVWVFYPPRGPYCIFLKRHRHVLSIVSIPFRHIVCVCDGTCVSCVNTCVHSRQLLYLPLPVSPSKRSMELLQLRRDRVVRANSIIDKNQALILSAPNLLPRLMELLRVMNFNPSLALFGEMKRVCFVLVCGGGVGGGQLKWTRIRAVSLPIKFRVSIHPRGGGPFFPRESAGGGSRAEKGRMLGWNALKEHVVFLFLFY